MNTPEQKNPLWQPRPLNQKGDLDSWKRRMQNLCPSPYIGQVVYLTSSQYDQIEDRTINNRIGYLCINFRPNGEPVWERGETTEVPMSDE
jgi:hypothetical protein